MQAQISILRIAGKPTVDRFFTRVFKLRYPTLLRVVWSVTYLERHELVKRAPPSVAPPSIKRATSKDFETWKDALPHPLFKDQWHLVNDEHSEHMMNTTPVWELCFSGCPGLLHCISRQMIWRMPLYVLCYFYYSWASFFDPEFCSRMPRTLTTSTTTSSSWRVRSSWH